MTKIARYPLNADSTPMDLLVGVLVDETGNGGARLENVPRGPDDAPIDTVGLILTDAQGTPIIPGSGGGSASVADRATMSALVVVGRSAVYLAEEGREGDFIHYTNAEFLAETGDSLAAFVAADTLQGIYVATGTGAWVRQEDKITPFMFGGQTNYSYGDRALGTYGESFDRTATSNADPDAGVLVDSRAACQAVIEMVKLHKRRKLVADFSGGIWGISKRNDGGAYAEDGLFINQSGEYPRVYIGGEFRGIGSGRNVIYVRGAQYCRFAGIWHIRTGADLSFSYGYAARQWENCLWVRGAAYARWEQVRLSGAKRWGVELDIEYSDIDYNNNIGLRFERVYANNCGSACDRPSNVFTIDFTASSRIGGSMGVGQLTNLTLAAGHEILRVGDLIRSPAGSYHFIETKVGNVIGVFPWIISTAATGTLTCCHGGAFRARGKDIAGAGADQLTGVGCGATLDITGVLHGTEWGNVILEGGGIGMLCGTLNGIDLGHTIAKMHSEGNSQDLIAYNGSNTELVIGGCSAWADQDYMDAFKKCLVLSPNDGVSLTTNVGLPSLTIFLGGEWLSTGYAPTVDSIPTKSRAFFPVLSNNPNSNLLTKVVTGDANITLKYYESVDRCLRASFMARLELAAPDGTKPTGAITVTMNGADAAAGVTLNGLNAPYVIAAGTATDALVIDFWLDTNGGARNWIPLIRSGAPAPISGGDVEPFTGGRGKIIVDDGNTRVTPQDNSYLVEKTAGGTGFNAAAISGLSATGDHLVKVKWETGATGIRTVGVATNPTAADDRLWTGVGLYLDGITMIATSNGVQIGLPVNSIAHNYAWIKRIAATDKFEFYYGASPTFSEATKFYEVTGYGAGNTWTFDSSIEKIGDAFQVQFN